MAQKSVTLLDKLSTPVGVKWTLKENDEGRLEWQAENKSGILILDSKDKKKRTKGSEARHTTAAKPATRTGSNTGGQANRQRHLITAPVGQHGNRHGSPTRLKKSRNKQVMLEDVKAVAYDQLCEIEAIAPDFDRILFKAPQFDQFLYHLLYYFDCVFKKQDLEQKGLTSSSIEPGRQERKEFADSVARVELARKKLGRAYCHLVLGVGLTEAHHMGCGSRRVSDTYRDRSLYETLHQYCCFVVWITFRRKHFDVIKKEMGTILRSDTFNPAIRVKNAPDNDEDEKTDINDPRKKMSAAQYRRIHPKRPAIKSIINQRSPAIVSILPSSKEDAPHLFKQQRPPSPSSILASTGATLNDDAAMNAVIDEMDQVDIDIQNKTVRIGILHDSMDNYNPVSLLGSGPDSEQNPDEEGGEEANKDESEVNPQVDQSKSQTAPNAADAGVSSRAPTAMSYATTEVPSEF